MLAEVLLKPDDAALNVSAETPDAAGGEIPVGTIVVMDDVLTAGGGIEEREIALPIRLSLRDISDRDLRTTVLGASLSIPILVAPTAFHRLACDEGEVATAAAAGSAGTVIILSTILPRSMEDVVSAGGDEGEIDVGSDEGR